MCPLDLTQFFMWVGLILVIIVSCKKIREEDKDD